jgi:hypothetical protein
MKMSQTVLTLLTTKIGSLVTVSALLFSFLAIAAAQDPGWPRQLNKDGATLVIYQPQVDDWKNFTDLDFRFAFTITPPAGKQVIGVAVLHGTTVVDPENDLVTVGPLTITSTNFPSLEPASTTQMDQLLRAFIPPSVNISLRRLIASVPKKGSTTRTVELRNDPPAIFVSNRPAILLFVDGQPQYAAIPNAKLEFVANTTWPLFFDRKNSAYYLLVDKQWMTASALEGPWTPTNKLPKEMDKLPNDPEWASLKNRGIPPPKPTNAPLPTIFFSKAPAEVILFDGPPTYAPIPGTKLTYVVNTTSNVFFYSPTQQFYCLLAGRWFTANSLNGAWTYATPFLPSDFMHIPPASPAAKVLASVPGTEEAKDAVLLAQIPTTIVVNPTTAAAQVHVSYFGQPQFAPIPGTTLLYATNTENKVIQVGSEYYLCLQGIWFTSTTPLGSWTTATSVPQVIYTIPASSPVYNVTYVTQTVTPTGNIEASFTAGYLGGFITGTVFGAMVFSGTGFYYPPYFGVAVYGGYPVYVPRAYTYGPYGAWGGSAYTTAHGAYGISQTVFGPNGSATRFAQYNPYTGTYARGASVSTPYGSRSVVQAYNPYTGTYAAHASGSSPSGQWGSSVVSGPGGTAYGQHNTTAWGTTGSVQTSAGGRAAGVSTAQGDAWAGKTANGDLYAGHDGNVYRNTGSGWQKYNNGTWNNANPQQGVQNFEQQHPNSQQDAQNFQKQHPNAPQDFQNFEQQHPQMQQGFQNFEQQHPQAQQSDSSGSSERGGVRPGASPAPQGLNQELQNRQRGSQWSERFQQSRGGGHFTGRHR